jgi:serine/threonine-protein kinase RsbW
MVSMMKTKTITFVLKSDLHELKNLCHHCEHFGQSIGLSKKFIFETNLALDELFTNIVSYSFTDQKEHYITISITRQEDMLTLRIEDDGLPFNPLNAIPPDLTCDLEDVQIGGLGIHIINRLMDSVSYRRSDNKNILILKKAIHRTTAKAC